MSQEATNREMRRSSGAAPRSPQRPCNIKRQNAMKRDLYEEKEHFQNPLFTPQMTMLTTNVTPLRRDSDHSTTSDVSNNDSSTSSFPHVTPISIPKWMTEITVKR